MQKQKLITLLIIIIVILVALVFFLLGSQKKVLAPEEENKEEVQKEKTVQKSEVKREISGNKEDLSSFSIQPEEKVSGLKKFSGLISGGYFFEGSAPISILDANKKLLKGSFITGATDWMTTGPVTFSGEIDFTGLPKGPAYIKIEQDDPSGGESGREIRSVLIPIVIE